MLRLQKLTLDDADAMLATRRATQLKRSPDQALRELLGAIGLLRRCGDIGVKIAVADMADDAPGRRISSSCPWAKLSSSTSDESGTAVSVMR